MAWQYGRGPVADLQEAKQIGRWGSHSCGQKTATPSEKPKRQRLEEVDLDKCILETSIEPIQLHFGGGFSTIKDVKVLLLGF